MTEQEKSTEEQIFDAAQTVFVKKGFEGARMEEIAKEAGINKALLHYYYRTKEKLFKAIFTRVFNHFVPRIITFIESDAPLFSKIEFFIGTYIDLIMQNPYIPNFIISELNRNPDNIAEMLGNATGLVKDKAFKKFAELIHIEIKNGTIRPISPEHLIVNIIGLCIFPVISRPIIQGIIFENNKDDYKIFLESRKKEVTSFIINSIKIEK
jgi:TetR/AcrR family transcriptional regulator